MDANRDLQIDFNNPADTTSGTNLFWLNDDYDVKAYVGGGAPDGWAEDDDRKKCDNVKNCDDDYIGHKAKKHCWSTAPPASENNCLRDLEDFTVVQLKVPGVVSNLSGITYWLKFENVTSGNPKVNLFKAITNGVSAPFDYLTDSLVASNQVKELRAFTNLDSNAQEVSADYINRYDQPIGFLLEGCTAGKGDLTFILKQNDSEICRSSVSLELQSITNFFDVYKVYQNDPTNRTKWEADIASNAVQVQTVTAYTPEADKYLLLVHGWNVSPDEKASFAQSAFKRLWWQKYKGRFGFFNWPTLYDYPNASTLLHNYDDSEMIAWLSSTALARLMENLNSSGHLRVWAHSMGNVVMGEGLRKYSGANKIKTYVATQAAVSGEAYDQGAPATTFGWLGFYGPDTPRINAYWPSGNTSTTNQPLLSGNAAKVDNMCNYFNALDWALDWWEFNNRRKPDDGFGYGFDYGGSITNYDITESATPTNRFCRWAGQWFDIEGLEIIPETNLVERYQVFAYCEESRTKALGQASNAVFNAKNWNLETDPNLKYESTHYSHSKEFRSNLPDQRKYYEYLMQDCNF
jgi:hypothetical protein